MTEKICIALLLTFLVSAFADVGKSSCQFIEWHGRGCNQIKLRYYYNETTKKCTHFKWNGCGTDGVFATRFDCVGNCSQGQGAAFCAEPPAPYICPEGTSRNSTRYYYNVTSRTCQEFKACGRPDRLDDVNYFLNVAYCEKQCGGFGTEDVYGRPNGNTTK